MKTGICIFTGKEISTGGRAKVVVLNGCGDQCWLALWSEFKRKFMRAVQRRADHGDFYDTILGLETIKFPRRSSIMADMDMNLFRLGAPIGQVAILIDALHPWAHDLVGYLNSASRGGTTIMGENSKPRPVKTATKRGSAVRKRHGNAMRHCMTH